MDIEQIKTLCAGMSAEEIEAQVMASVNADAVGPVEDFVAAVVALCGGGGE